MTKLTALEWDLYLSRFPEAHLLQSSAWGDLKSNFGWRVVRLNGANAGAQILFRRLPLGFKLAYIPKGPLGEPDEGFWQQVDRRCRQERAVFLKVEPDCWQSFEGELPEKYRKDCPKNPPTGFILSPESIQPPRTLVVGLDADDDTLLGRMKQKTRYNIHLSRKKGVVVRQSDDIGLFHNLSLITGERDRFGVHSLDYYRQAYELFHPVGACQLLVAEYQSEPLAAVIVFAYGWRAWYFYGASSNAHRERMPNYLLQWEAIRWARAQGCKEYDLWGVPDESLAKLEDHFNERSDGLWGVYRFKRGFGGELRRAAGPWDRIYIPWLYNIYRRWVQHAR